MPMCMQVCAEDRHIASCACTSARGVPPCVILAGVPVNILSSFQVRTSEDDANDDHVHDDTKFLSYYVLDMH